MSRGKRGYSYVEILVVSVLLVMASSGFALISEWNRKATESMAKVEFLARLRGATMNLSRAVSNGSRIIYPTTVSEEYVSKIIFRTNQDQVAVLFLNEENELALYSGWNGAKVLISNTVWLKARLVRENLIEIRFKIKQNNFQCTISDRLSLCNTLP